MGFEVTEERHNERLHLSRPLRAAQVNASALECLGVVRRA
jgi:hypothetical protein